MNKKTAKRRHNYSYVSLIIITLLALTLVGCNAKQEMHTMSTFSMDTIIDQQVYGKSAEKAMKEVNVALAEYDDRLSLFKPESDIARINASAGGQGADVLPETAHLIEQAVELSLQSENAFAITIAPLTLAWGITGDTPRIVPQEEIDRLLPLVDDSRIKIKDNHVTLLDEGMGIDLGGIAKGAACEIAKDIYVKNGIESALINLGGNIYTHGKKPDGTPFRVGFSDPMKENGSAYIASFPLENQVIAVSGGYERYADINDTRFIHIIDPKDGYPVESDILSVGAICNDGGEADFYSTTFFVWGKEQTLNFMKSQQDIQVIMLDYDKNLYVSAGLEDGLTMHDKNSDYKLQFISGDTA